MVSRESISAVSVTDGICVDQLLEGPVYGQQCSY